MLHEQLTKASTASAAVEFGHIPRDHPMSFLREYVPPNPRWTLPWSVVVVCGCGLLWRQSVARVWQTDWTRLVRSQELYLYLQTSCVLPISKLSIGCISQPLNLISPFVVSVISSRQVRWLFGWPWKQLLQIRIYRSQFEVRIGLGFIVFLESSASPLQNVKPSFQLSLRLKGHPHCSPVCNYNVS